MGRRSGKTAKCIRMLQYLSSGRTVHIDEIAKFLDNTFQDKNEPRNVVEYRKELERAGYIIEYTSGRHGGYHLLNSVLIPSIKFDEEERKAMVEASAFLRKRSDFPWSDAFESATSKLFASFNHETESPLLAIQIKKGTMSAEEIMERFRTIEFCIKHKTKLFMQYLSNDNQVRERIIHPYKLFIYNESWFTIGYCERAEDFRVFKLVRIKECHPIGQKFRVSLLYNEKDHFDEFGFKGSGNGPNATNHDEWVHIKLKLTDRPAMYVKDSVYGKNQTITETEDGATILECDMHYRSSTIRFALGFGEDCEVLEPEWLKDELIRQASRILEIEKSNG